MITRVTDSLKYSIIKNNIFNVQNEFGDLTEKISTQKKINRPSDDPIGTNDILNLRTVSTSIDQYQSNITDANTWLNLTSTNLAGLRNIFDQVKSIAISESGTGGSPETRATSVATLTSLIDETLSLINAKHGDNYLFSGSATNIKPFSDNAQAASVSVSATETNTYSGTVTSVGTYIPTENKSYVVKIVDGGTLANATYKVSTDGGKNWGATSLAGDLALGTINNLGGDDIDLIFPAGTFASNDTFTVNLSAAGYYQGNDDKLNTLIGKNNNIVYNITGAEAFTGQFASGSVINGGSGITADDSIVLTKNAITDLWEVTSQTNYPNMTIASQTAESLTIDADSLDGNPPDIIINLTGEWNGNNTINLSLTAGSTSGKVPVTFTGSGSVDLLSTLNALKTALQETDQNRAEKLIAAQVDNITTVETQILQYETQSGAKMSSLETTSSNHDAFNLQIKNMLSEVETADMTQLIIDFQMKQISMQALYNMASKIGKMTIMDYL